MKLSITKEDLVKKIRMFFEKRDFHEIFPPILSSAVPLEPHLHPFSTMWETREGTKTLYLAQSPERGIKHTLAQGMGNCYAIGHSFRNLEQIGSLHSPEFLMLEWYRKDADYMQIMSDTKDLLAFCAQSPLAAWQTRSLRDLFMEYAHIDLIRCIQDEPFLVSYMRKRGYVTQGASWDELYDQLFVQQIEPHLCGTVFVTDFPARLSPLCKPQKKNPLFAERFEVYIDGVEIGNGNTEETDSTKIRAVFEAQHKVSGLPIDEAFLAALDRIHGESFAGIGIGIERLHMVLNGLTSCF